jgi:hypothetical protein
MTSLYVTCVPMFVSVDKCVYKKMLKYEIRCVLLAVVFLFPSNESVLLISALSRAFRYVASVR